MTGGRQRTVGTAALALALALVIPARAVALCCLVGSTDHGSLMDAHDGAHHHGADRAPETESALATAAPASTCAPATPAPLLRERDDSGGPPGADDATLRSDAIVVARAPSPKAPIPLDRFASPPDRGGAPRPLRL